MEKKLIGYVYSYSYRNSRGMIRNVRCGHVYRTHKECDEALCRELSELERNDLEHFGGDIHECYGDM